MIDFLQIKTSVLYDKELSVTERMVLMSLIERATTFKLKCRLFECHQEWIANAVGISLRCVKTALATLEGKGYILVQRQYHKANKYMVLNMEEQEYSEAKKAQLI